VHVIATHLSERDLPRLYKAADAFVLPSRGEGWGSHGRVCH
jgi:glycosyltransferase involved in cell wall biosynthesis